MRSTTKSGSTAIPRSSSIEPRVAEATGLVKAPGSGVTKVIETSSRRPLAWR